MNLLLALFFSLFSFAAPMGIQEEWSQVSNPLIMSAEFDMRFYALPLRGEVRDGTKFWSGDYWALNKGNIDLRWNANRRMAGSSAPTKAELLRMPQEEIAQLSPAEKFDILNGLYHYPLKSEVRKIANPEARNWEGICHGWAPAAMNHNEPTPKVLSNADGIRIPFGSSDIKALLSYFYAYPYYVENTRQIGRRCYGGRTVPDRDCKQDLNAGAFHIVLANKIGKENVGFVADMDRWEQVWNHPIMGYETIVQDEEGRARRGAAPGTIRTLKVKTTLRYVDENSNSWDVTGRKMLKKEVEYFLELNAQGMIIGGEWRNLARPDFLWLKERPTFFAGLYYKLPELLND